MQQGSQDSFSSLGQPIPPIMTMRVLHHVVHLSWRATLQWAALVVR